MKRTSSLLAAAAFTAALAFAAAGPPLAGVWNIATSGKAASSGDLSFRIIANDGSDPLDITVPVISGAADESVARSIRQALGSQLPQDRYNVRLGEGTNVLVSDPHGLPTFSLELVDSNVENLRVAVQSVTPSAPPTVPPQATPAEGTAVTPPPKTIPAPSTEAPRSPNTSPPSDTPGGAGVSPNTPPPKGS